MSSLLLRIPRHGLRQVNSIPVFRNCEVFNSEQTRGVPVCIVDQDSGDLIDRNILVEQVDNQNSRSHTEASSGNVCLAPAYRQTYCQRSLARYDTAYWQPHAWILRNRDPPPEHMSSVIMCLSCSTLARHVRQCHKARVL